jgi:phage tail-like protein
MSADTARSFHFSTAAQWNACLIVDADAEALRAGAGIQPFAAYERTATRLASTGAQVPVALRGGDILWRDDNRHLHRLAPCDDVPEVTPAPSALAFTGRIVSTASGLWAIDGSSSLARFEPDTLTRLLVVDLPGTRIVDIADDGRDGLFVLARRGEAWEALHVNVNGRVTEAIVLPGIEDPLAFTFLRRSQRFVVLVRDCHQRLHWLAIADGLPGEGRVARPLFSRAVAGYHPCFAPVPLPDPCAETDDEPAAVPPSVLASDRRDRIYLAGQDGAPQGGGAWVLLIDADGNAIGNVPVEGAAPPTGVAATASHLLVTSQRGLLRYAAATVVPDGADQTRCVLVTPVLGAPDREDGRRWLRIDARASLPEGSAIEIAYASTDDSSVRDRLAEVAANANVPVSQRVAAVLNENDIWHAPTTFIGAAGASGSADSFSAKLFDTTDRFVWVRVALTATAGAALPCLSALDVRYPGQTLMASLPGIYQREESRPDSFLRALVGVLEATTQGVDARIAQLAGHLEPSTAAPEWLDFVARWLGVPWDDGLDVGQKRRILARAALLASARGTRAGLEALLEALMSGSPRRFRVVDTTADYGFARVGGGTCLGTALPAMLGGASRWNAVLDERAVLGSMRLPCPNQPDDGVGRLAGRIRVDVAASAAERAAWEPWLASVLGAMVPVTARLTLRWVSRQALQGNRLDGTLTLDAPPAPHLGTDAITNLARLPERGHRLSRSGPRISTDLR